MTLTLAPTIIGPTTDIYAYVTSFVPLTTTFPVVSGCESSFWASVYRNYTSLVAFEPSYGLSADKKLTCLPTAITPWWQQTYGSTYTKIGPVVCPAAYSTVWSSTISTWSGVTVACCPTGYTFQGVEAAGDIGECASIVPAGRSLTFAYNTSGTVITTATTTLANTSTVWAVPVNGFIPLQSSASTTASQTAPSASASSAVPHPQGGMSTSTKIAIGVGVPLGILVLISIFAAAYFLGSYRRRRRQQPRTMMHEIYPESEGKP